MCRRLVLHYETKDGRSRPRDYLEELVVRVGPVEAAERIGRAWPTELEVFLEDLREQCARRCRGLRSRWWGDEEQRLREAILTGHPLPVHLDLFLRDARYRLGSFERQPVVVFDDVKRLMRQLAERAREIDRTSTDANEFLKGLKAWGLTARESAIFWRRWAWNDVYQKIEFRVLSGRADPIRVDHFLLRANEMVQNHKRQATRKPAFRQVKRLAEELELLTRTMLGP